MLIWLVFLFFIPFGFSIFAQRKIVKTFIKHNVLAERSLNGSRIATELLTLQGIHDVKIEKIKGNFTDNYDFSVKAIRLSNFVYSNHTISAVAVASYVTTKAIMYKKNDKTFMLFIKLQPFASFVSSLGFSFLFLGLIFFFFAFINALISVIGVFLYFLAMGFYVYFLKMEKRVSNKAYELLETSGYLTPKEYEASLEVLKAYRFTYIAGIAIFLVRGFEGFRKIKK
ncbi:MAG: zinc metallopeptidase [Defluviitaleaceae bacterium]|nr:zinc metallopeptidase [Defluviitaleaceae bacterium]